MSTHRLSVGSSGSPTPRSHVEHSLSWTDDLPVCHLSGVGFATNQIYREDGFRCEEHEFEDRSIHFRCEGGLHLYGVFDGHDGSKVSHFAAQRMPAELLLGQISDRTDDEQIKDILTQAFISVEKGFFDSIDDVLAQKANLMLHVPEGIKQYELFNKYPELFKRLELVETEIAGGSTAVVALIKDTKLFIANVGCSRALLCTTDQAGVLRVVQLSSDHNLQNEDELDRFAQQGVDVDKLLELGKMGESTIYTRTIGDHEIKTRIRERDQFKDATSDPVIAEPYVTGGIPIDDMQGFLILMSYGLFKSFLDATGTEHVNRDLAGMVASEFASQSTLNGVAQAVVDKVVRRHHDAFMTCSDSRKQLCQKRKDMTLLVRNFNYPLPNAVSSPTSGSLVNPLSALAFSRGGHGATQISEPLSVVIPQDKAPPPAPASLTIYMSRPSMTNTNSHTATTNLTNINTIQSSNDSTQSGEESCRLFQSRSRDTGQLDLDADGKIASYVDFSDFYTAIEEMTEAQRETFNSTSEPKPAYETIPEEPLTPQGESLPILNGPETEAGSVSDEVQAD